MRKKNNRFYAVYNDLQFVFLTDNSGKVYRIYVRKRKDGGNISEDRFFQEKINEYFNSNKDYLDIPFILNFSQKSFSFRILNNLRKIKRGKTISYAELAIQSGYTFNHARAVGQVLKNNPLPLIFPCHRVILLSGEIGGFAGKTDSSIKRQLINLESGIGAGERI